MWQATQGIFDALTAVGTLLVPIGLIVLGVAMLGAPAFGKVFGGVSVVLGVVGVVGASFFVVDPLSPITFVGTFLGALAAFVIFLLLFGWKVYSLSRAA